MQRLQFVLFQIDEASRYIRDGRLEHVRLALLILDNAIEVQLRHHAQFELERERVDDQLRRSVASLPKTRHVKELEELLKIEPLNKKQIKSIHYSFSELVWFLCNRRKTIDPRMAEIIKYIHGLYRNDAYHNATVRKETITTAAEIFEVDPYSWTLICDS